MSDARIFAISSVIPALFPVIPAKAGIQKSRRPLASENKREFQQRHPRENGDNKSLLP